MTTPTPSSAEQAAQIIRDWAKASGIKYGERGIEFDYQKLEDAVANALTSAHATGYAEGRRESALDKLPIMWSIVRLHRKGEVTNYPDYEHKFAILNSSGKIVYEFDKPEEVEMALDSALREAPHE